MNIIIILLICTTTCCVAELFSSTPSLAELLKTENALVEALDRSLEEIDKLRDDLESYKKKFKFHENITEDFVLKHISNPINSFTLIKRLYLDLENVHTIYKETFEHISSELFSNDSRLLPNKNDMSGIAMLLKELQVGYSLNLTEFANGYIRGIKYGESLSATEIYELGKTICDADVGTSCISFLKEALRKWEDGEEIARIEIMRAISDAYYKSKDLTASVEWDDRILKEEDPNDVVTLLHKAQNLQELKNRYNIAEKNEDLPKPVDYDYDRDTVSKFYSLCNGENKLPEEITSKLSCFYKYGEHPFLRLAPLKMEQLYLEPEIFIIRQMLSENEIAELIEFAQEKLHRSTLVVNGSTTSTPHRVGSTAFFSATPLSKRILRRSADLTELGYISLDLQVNHYPPGGYFRPHYDMMLRGDKYKYPNGNRIATVLHYLTDVEHGGGTAFPFLGITVLPQRGSAVYWRNLHSSGEADIRTIHGGCPVLHGIKWVANAWAHTQYQEEATPCGLEYIPESYNVTSLSRYLERKSQWIQDI